MKTRTTAPWLAVSALALSAACQSLNPSSPLQPGEHFAEVTLRFES